MSDRDELLKLRMSLVRIAQATGMTAADFPPVLKLSSFDWDDLVVTTQNQERGWNALAATIVGRIEDREREWQDFTCDMGERFRAIAARMRNE